MKYDFLKNVPLFADLPEADLIALCEQSDEVRLEPGQLLFAEGDAGDRAYVTVEGEIEIVKASGDREVLLAVRGPGEVIGEMALLEETPRMASVRARGPATLMSIQKQNLQQLMETSLPATRTMFYTILARWRATEAMLRQGEKMAQLGTLTAGVAHDLNNPAAAVRRGADQIVQAISRYGLAQVALAGADLSVEQREAIAQAAAEAVNVAANPPDIGALIRSDREFEVQSWLEEVGVADAWEHAPALVSMGYETADLQKLAGRFNAPHVVVAVELLAASFAVYNLLAEIGQGASRISDIVKALKSYSYLDQAPIQEVDVHEGLDNTLLILHSKLKTGVDVHRDYGKDVPRIQAYGSELNQVWTNLIDNAADALDGKGDITLRTQKDGGWVVVEVEDNGPGIPPDIQSRVFDAFFTTKPPGKGTGMGLDISYNIVVYKHHGDIQVRSEPGKTVFTVRLPVEGL